MYKSPIEIKIDDIVSDAVERVDKYIVGYIQQVGVNVDKDELTKALKFDKEQYEQGWNDRDSQIVRCKDCKWWNSSKGWCSDNGSYWRSSDFCSDAERREKK